MRSTHFQNLKLLRTVFVQESNWHAHHAALVPHICLLDPLGMKERGSVLF